MDSGRLPEELGLTDQDIESLSQAGLVPRRPQKLRPKKWVVYEALRLTYTKRCKRALSPTEFFGELIVGNRLTDHCFFLLPGPAIAGSQL
jgi:hypothetical protein